MRPLSLSHLLEAIAIAYQNSAVLDKWLKGTIGLVPLRVRHIGESEERMGYEGQDD